jgi:hypothetical protein
MTFSLAPYAYARVLAAGIRDRVVARDGLILLPSFVSKAVLGHLRTGIRALEAFLRRRLILWPRGDLKTSRGPKPTITVCW